MTMLVKISALTFLFFTVSVHGRDIGNFRIKPPLETILNVSYTVKDQDELILEEERVDNTNNKEISSTDQNEEFNDSRNVRNDEDLLRSVQINDKTEVNLSKTIEELSPLIDKLLLDIKYNEEMLSPDNEGDYNVVKSNDGSLISQRISNVTFRESNSLDERKSGCRCRIDIKTLPRRTPIITDPRTREIVYPDSPVSSVISMKKGGRFRIDCPGSKIQFDGGSASESADAVCISGSTVRILETEVDYTEVICQRIITKVARYTDKRCFGKEGKEIEIGFEFRDGHFIQLMTICFNDVSREVFYSKFDMHHRIGQGNINGVRPTWTEGKFYNLPITLNKLYPKKEQMVHINRQLGLRDDDTTYIKTTGNYFLAKGHLTANGDMFYYSQQEATFFYVNSVPQWQTFNGGNWATLEANIRKLSVNKKLNFEIITGAYGVSTLPHTKTGRQVQLYLYAGEESDRAIPVPEIFYKVVYSSSTLQGVVIIGVNNPYQEDATQSVYCDDVVDKLTWISFNRTRIDRGYIYACTIADFRKIVRGLPKYNVRGLLV